MERLILTFKRKTLTAVDHHLPLLCLLKHKGTPQAWTQFQCKDYQPLQFRNATFPLSASVCSFPVQNTTIISPSRRCSVQFSTVLFPKLLVAGFHSRRSFHVFSLPFPTLSCSSLVAPFHAEQTCSESSLLLTLPGIDQLSFPLCVLQNIFVMKGVMDEYSIILITFRKEQCDNGNATE